MYVPNTLDVTHCKVTYRNTLILYMNCYNLTLIFCSDYRASTNQLATTFSVVIILMLYCTTISGSTNGVKSKFLFIYLTL